MVLDDRNTRTPRQQMAEMTSPTSRIFAGSIATHFCPIQDDFDAPTQPARGFSLLTPNWLEHLKKMIGVDVLHGNRAEHRRSVAGPRISPLLPMFFVFPADFVRADVDLGAVTELIRR
jgi:hypothetical protein